MSQVGAHSVGDVHHGVHAGAASEQQAFLHPWNGAIVFLHELWRSGFVIREDELESGRGVTEGAGYADQVAGTRRAPQFGSA